jgi:hypothetical protein
MQPEMARPSFEESAVVSSSSTGAILSKIIELEQQGADLFFLASVCFEVKDLSAQRQ